MSKEFSIGSAKKYIQSLLIQLGMILLIVIAGIFRLSLSDLKYKEIYIVTICTLYTIVIIVGIFKAFTDYGRTYIINPHSIQIKKNNKINTYAFEKLKRIKRASSKDREKTGLDYVEITFEDDLQIKLSNNISYYHAFRKYLKKTLKAEGYYSKIAIYNDF